MQGWGWTKVHHPDHVDRVVERIRRSWKTGEPWEDTFPLRGGDGRFRSFLSRALPIRDEAGSVVCWFGTNTDVTERLEAEDERERLLASERSARHRAEGILKTALDGISRSTTKAGSATSTLRPNGCSGTAGQTPSARRSQS